MALTNQQMEHLQQLARLELAPEEMERMRHTLDRVLGYVDRLGNIDTIGIPEMEESELVQGLRSDEASFGDEVVRELILTNFPDRAGDALRVPAVFENPKG